MLTDPIRNKLEQISARSTELEALLSDPLVLSDMKRYRTLAKESGSVARIAGKYRKLAALEKSRDEAAAIIDEDPDGELAALAREELSGTESEIAGLEEEILNALVQTDDDSRRDVIVEIRAGTGGEEAALFAGDLYRIYAKYAESKGWKTDIVNAAASDMGGFREIVFDIKGDDVYAHMRYESGGHRVQRVPETEGAGRIHTSAVTVAVLPEAEEVDLEVKDGDLKIDRYCASGAGGQHVNKTASAIRITHLPTNVVVTCQDEKSQIKNLAKAMRVLRSRLYEREVRIKKEARDAARKSQIGSGDRSDRVRTYNYPQNRVTDHRVNQNYSLEQVIDGKLDKVIDDLKAMHREQMLAELE